MSLFLQGQARLFLLVHAVTAFAGVGATTHLAIYTTGLWLGREHWRVRARLFGVIAATTLAVPFVIGLLIYPLYRVQVRMDYLDAHAPGVTALFDVKENLAACALPIILSAAALTRWPSARSVRGISAVLALSGAALVWTTALLGLYVTSYRAIGMMP